MDSRTAKLLHQGTEDEAIDTLIAFNTDNSKSFSFPNLDKDTKKRLVEGALERLGGAPGSARLHTACLETLRILSREKASLDCLPTAHALRLLVRHAGLETYAQDLGQDSANVTIQQGGDNTVIIEAQKCLCNIVFNSPAAQKTCSKNGCVEGIVQRMKTYKDPDLPYDIKYFDMRLLFLFTALVPETRLRIKTGLHGLPYLMEALDLAVEEEQGGPLSDQAVSFICELLKILFNVTIAIDKNAIDEEEEAHCQRLVSILHDLLLAPTASRDKAEELHRNTVNLLTNMPKSSYDELLTPVTEPTEVTCSGPEVTSAASECVEYDGKNMAAVVVLLRFLEGRLSEPKGSLKEKLAPALHCFCELCRENRTIRKFCRIKVLPPLGSEVKHLPEEGHALRNKLVHLFTSVVTEVKDLAADFCFVLCKESVARFVKYTGYGNAAGLLAQRGLMCGGRAAGSGQYSSESDESDTEEYAQLAPDVNQMTGRWEPQSNARPSVLEGMSEEQKEHEAMQLVNQFDRLNRCGVMQPVVVGADGRPRVVTDVHELVRGMGGEPGAEQHD